MPNFLSKSLLLAVGGLASINAWSEETDLSLGLGVTNYHFHDLSDVDIKHNTEGLSLGIAHYPYSHDVPNGKLHFGGSAELIYHGTFKGRLVNEAEPREVAEELMLPGSGLAVTFASKYEYEQAFIKFNFGGFYWKNRIKVDQVTIKKTDLSIIYGLEAGYQVYDNTSLSIGYSTTSYNSNDSRLVSLKVSYGFHEFVDLINKATK